MKEYMLLFRADYRDLAVVSAEETQNRNNRWIDWIDDLVENNHLAEGGNHLTPKGKILRSVGKTINEYNLDTDESILGYILILASSLDEAVEVARGCPILAGEGTSVEVREVAIT